MDNQVINPVFLKALIRCHLLSKETRRRVNHNKRFLKQSLKVFRWSREIRRQEFNRDLIEEPPQTSKSPPTLDQKDVLKQESGADLDIVRRNLWTMIVRKDIIQAYRRKVSHKEQRLLKFKTIAYRCQSHLSDLNKCETRSPEVKGITSNHPIKIENVIESNS